MAGIKIIDLPAVGRDLISTDLLELSLAGGTGSRKITGQQIMNASKLSVGTTPVVGGTAGRIFFEGAGNVLQENANLFWDNATNQIQVVGTGLFSSGVNSNVRISGGGIEFSRTVDGAYNTYILKNGSTNSVGLTFAALNGGSFIFQGTSEIMRTTSTNNVLIGTTTDAGYKLDVNGTARVQGNLFVNTGSTPSSGLSIGDNTTASLLAYYSGGLYFKVLNTDAMTLTSGTNGGLYIGAGGLQASYKLEVNGTAKVATSILVGSSAISASAYPLQVVGGAGGSALFSNATQTQAINFNLTTAGETRIYTDYFLTGADQKLILGTFANRTNQLVLNTTGNIGIGTTTDAGYRLDVNGTARVTGNFNVSGGQGITTINPNTITGGTDFFVVKTASLGSFITARENGNLLLGPTSGSRAILYDALTFSNRSNSSMNFNNGGGYVPMNLTNQAGLFINASYTNAGAGATSEGALYQFQGNTATSIGDVTLNQISMKPTYNNTGGTTINRGFYYNPTLTSMVGTTHWAIHTTSGRVRFEGLPTSPVGLNAGDLYNDAGTIKIV